MTTNTIETYNYFGRVELHGAKWSEDYEDLHKRLAKLGFTNCITFTDGSSKNLPSGFYFAKSLSGTTPELCTKVRLAADATGYDNEVIVIRSGGSTSTLSEECE